MEFINGSSISLANPINLKVGNISFPNTVPALYNNSTLFYYKADSLTPSLTGARNNIVGLKLSKIGNAVCLTLQGCGAGVALSGSRISLPAGTIPIDYRPSSDIVYSIIVLDNTTTQLGRCVVQSNGGLTIAADLINSAFTLNDQAVYETFSVSYNV